MSTFTGWATALNTVTTTTGTSGTISPVGVFPGTFLSVFDHSTTTYATITPGNPIAVQPDGAFTFVGAASSYDLVFTLGAASAAAVTAAATASFPDPLTGAHGGTGTAFFTVAGPTAPRTYTFPDLAATIVTATAANIAANNTLVGVNAGGVLTSGFSVTAMGFNAGAADTSGDSNTYYGTQAGASNSLSNYNTYLGSFAGWLEGGQANCYVGYKAGWVSTGGDRNTYVGNSSAFSATTGDDNTALGYDSGKVVTTGSTNTALGSLTSFSAAAASGQTVVGYGATALGDNSLTLGRSTDVVHIPGDTLTFGAASDLVLFRSAANTLALVNGTTAQEFRIYNSTTNADLFNIAWAANAAYLQTTATGGVARPLNLRTVGAASLFLGTGSTTRLTLDGTTGAATFTAAFGCNGATARTAAASGGALNAYGAGANGFDTAGNASAVHALVVAIRLALVNNGIMS